MGRMIITDEAEFDLVQNFLAAKTGYITFRLCTSPIIVTDTTTLADLVAVEAAYTGYSPQTQADAPVYSADSYLGLPGLKGFTTPYVAMFTQTTDPDVSVYACFITYTFAGTDYLLSAGNIFDADPLIAFNGFSISGGPATITWNIRMWDYRSSQPGYFLFAHWVAEIASVIDPPPGTTNVTWRLYDNTGAPITTIDGMIDLTDSEGTDTFPTPIAYTGGVTSVDYAYSVDGPRTITATDTITAGITGSAVFTVPGI